MAGVAKSAFVHLHLAKRVQPLLLAVTSTTIIQAFVTRITVMQSSHQETYHTCSANVAVASISQFKGSCCSVKVFCRKADMRWELPVFCRPQLCRHSQNTAMHEIEQGQDEGTVRTLKALPGTWGLPRTTSLNSRSMQHRLWKLPLFHLQQGNPKLSQLQRPQDQLVTGCYGTPCIWSTKDATAFDRNLCLFSDSSGCLRENA